MVVVFRRMDYGSGPYQALSAASVPGDTVTFSDSGPLPTGTFNVLVIASPQGGWNPYPDYSALTAASLTQASFGSRIMLTGQDADWHNIFGPGPVANGPAGFLFDSINWSGSGTGLGLVALGQDGSLVGVTAGYSNVGGATNNVVIPTAFASFPINTGLTSAGLSNWATSAHDEFGNLDTSIWTGINVDGGVCGADGNALGGGPCNNFVTIVTNGGSGGIGTPEPGTLVMFGSGIVGLAGFIRRKLML